MKSPSILQAIALTGVLAISHASNWTGDGGKGTSITIDAPKASGLAENQSHLPTVVQAELISNFLDYSAISVLDWAQLGEIYSKLGSGVFGGDSADAAMQDLGQLAPTTHFMSGKITKTATGYHLQMTITKTSDKMTVASYSGNFSYWDLDNRTGIRKASLELLKKMGVSLTEQAQKELAGAATSSQISGQTAFAKGITAQRQGNEVAALSYYFQAATFDPSLKEAINRSSTLNASIASGNMGDNVRNDIQWRKQWVDRLRETEEFFDNFNKMESMPYTLFYSKEINQGKINYQNETVALSIETYLYGSEVWTVSIERALQAVYDGLNATKRKEDWGLDRWPQKGVTELKAFERRSNNFSVVFELVNNQNKVIGSQALQASGSWGLNWSGRPRVEVSRADRKTLNFQNVNANDITDNLTIRVASVNGADAETAAINGVLQIKAITKYDANLYDSFRFLRGVVQGFTNSYAEKVKDLVIPNAIWGDLVISIGNEAFKNAELTSVTIPNGVTSIGDEAFMNTKLTKIIIGDNVIIGTNSFFGKKYYSGDGRIIVQNEFQKDYIENGKRAGIYYIKTISKSEVDMYDCFRFSKGEVQGFMCAESMEDLVIPQTIWGEPVTSIGKEAFKNAGLLTENAYKNSKLRSVVIPNGVTSIGELAFANAGLTSVVIPNSVTSIGKMAFYEPKNYEGRKLLRITIGANVAMAEDSFEYGNRYADQDIAGENSFYKYYNKNKKKAGTYTGKERSIIITLLTGGFVAAPTWKYSEK